MKILIIGGSRFVGPLVIDLLLKRKHKITVFNRGNLNTKYPKEVRFVQGNRNKGFGLTEKFDTVIDMCSYNGTQTEQALDELKFDYFLHFSTVASYKKTELFPITENFEIGIWPSFGEYNKGKAECEKVLSKRKIEYGMIRPVYILGPKNYCDRENFIYSHIKKGLELTLPGNGQGLTQFVFADEVAKIIVMLVEKKLVGAFNVCGNEIISLIGLVEEMGRIVGKIPKIKFNPNNIGISFNEVEFPFDNESIIASNEKIKKILKFNFIPLFDGLRKDYKKYYQKTT